MAAEPPSDALARSAVLRRRVLLTGTLSILFCFAAGAVLTATGGPDWLLIAALGLWMWFVVRPLLRPVRQELRARREAWTAQRR